MIQAKPKQIPTAEWLGLTAAQKLTHLRPELLALHRHAINARNALAWLSIVQTMNEHDLAVLATLAEAGPELVKGTRE